MSAIISIREFGALTSTPTENTLDRACIPEAAFEYLCREQAKFRATGASLVHLEDRRLLRLDQYVGVVQTPGGVTIEILPKHVDGSEDLPHIRSLMARMISRVLDVPVRESGPAALRLLNYPLSEWILRQYLLALQDLVRSGIRFEYRFIEEESRFIRGQLNLPRQLRQPPDRKHRFNIRHDVFLPDRPENRLLKSALNVAFRLAQHPDNWRLANELTHYLEIISASVNHRSDFAAWRSDKIMANYRAIRPWCELLLNRLNPTTQPGDWSGISLLFPMDRLYERFVASCLRRLVRPETKITQQAASEYLCTHRGRPWFMLQPDLLLTTSGIRCVLDAKWKRLNQVRSSAEEKYGLSQGDFYQLLAYGERYLSGRGELFLVFPKTADFNRPLDPFSFSGSLRLWVVPFDLDAESFVEGDWVRYAPWYQSSSQFRDVESATTYTTAVGEATRLTRL